MPGEELAKVAYNLLDAHSYQDRAILVVGGGDAVEAALGLAEQTGNVVTLSYRQKTFTRLKSRNEARLLEASQNGALTLALESRVERIDPASVVIGFADGSQRVLPNDEVFVFAGGQAPQVLLEKVGVSFDPAERHPGLPLQEQGTGLFRALLVALFLTLTTVSWTFVFRGYYALDAHDRPYAREHAWLDPDELIGLMLGVAATICVLGNLAYLVRRSPKFERIPGSLQQWMTAHVATGIGALLFALVHSAMAPRHTVGGHALWAMAFLVVTGAIGRYFYAFVPRAANGRELALDEVKAELAQLSGEWDRQRPEFAQRVREELQRLIAEGRWKGTFLQRLVALQKSQRQLSESLARLRAEGRREGLAHEQLDALVALARRAQRTALTAAHYEDLRGLLNSWRWFPPLGRARDGPARRPARDHRDPLRGVRRFLMRWKTRHVGRDRVGAARRLPRVARQRAHVAGSDQRGARAGQELAGDGCEQCHVGEHNSGMAGACSKCHAEIAQQIARKSGLHGTLAGDANACARCHSRAPRRRVPARDAAGVRARGRRRSQAVRPRPPRVRAGLDVWFGRTPRRARVQGLPQAGRGRGAREGCEALPRSRAEMRELPRGRAQGQAPRLCLVSRTGAPVQGGREKFVHVASFPLVGAHLGPKCRTATRRTPRTRSRTSACALPPPPPARRTRRSRSARAGLPRLAAHRGVPPPRWRASERSRPARRVKRATRPRASSFADTRVTLTNAEHAATGFVLDGPHAKLACEDCHAKAARADEQIERTTFASFKKAYPGRAAEDCASCHGDPHFGQFATGAFAGAACTACHDEAHFSPPRSMSRCTRRQRSR